jgi:hypothetical protein
MNRSLALTLMLGLALGAAGCDEDFLTTIPSDRISDETFWQTEQDFTYAVNAAYRNIMGWTVIYLDNPSDLAYSQQYWRQYSDIARSQHSSQSGPHDNFWNDAYEGLARVNEVLARLAEADDAVLSAEARDRIEGQARFLRGYLYHELLWRFGGVPLLTTVPTPAEALEATRASRDAVFSQVRSDLEAAASLLPTDWPAEDDGRATQGAALAYLARAALYEASYQEYGAGDAGAAEALYRLAANSAQAVMNLGVYSLYPDFRELFMYAGEASDETIFAYRVNRGQNGWPSWYDFAPSSQGGNEVGLSPTRALVDKFRMTDGLYPSESPMYDPEPPVITYAGDVGTVESLGMYANRDPRFYATVLFPGAENFDGTVFNSYPACSGTGVEGYCSITNEALDPSNFYNTPTGYLGKKYLDPVDRAVSTDSGLDVMLMRFADVLLMYAEAKIELGEFDQSVNDAIFLVRDRVDMPGVDVTGMTEADAIAMIRDERAVELAWEGLRYADLRRWRMSESVMPGYVAGIDYYNGSGELVTARGDVERVFQTPRDYLWPIPASERELNPSLDQNPGY